jgi:hypothetical protein
MPRGEYVHDVRRHSQPGKRGALLPAEGALPLLAAPGLATVDVLIRSLARVQYCTKNPVQVTSALSIIRDVSVHIEKHPSVAGDADANRLRKAQHFLTRMLNVLNAKQEVSVTQAAACLLGMDAEMGESRGATRTPRLRPTLAGTVDTRYVFASAAVAHVRAENAGQRLNPDEVDVLYDGDNGRDAPEHPAEKKRRADAADQDSADMDEEEVAAAPPDPGAEVPPVSEPQLLTPDEEFGPYVDLVRESARRNVGTRRSQSFAHRRHCTSGTVCRRHRLRTLPRRRQHRSIRRSAPHQQTRRKARESVQKLQHETQQRPRPRPHLLS